MCEQCKRSAESGHKECIICGKNFWHCPTCGSSKVDKPNGFIDYPVSEVNELLDEIEKFGMNLSDIEAVCLCDDTLESIIKVCDMAKKLSESVLINK